MIIHGVASCAVGGCLWFLSIFQKKEVDELNKLKELSSLEGDSWFVLVLPEIHSLVHSSLVLQVCICDSSKTWCSRTVLDIENHKVINSLLHQPNRPGSSIAYCSSKSQQMLK